MAKTNANFNLSKESKKLIATGKTKEERSIIKRAFINAEHAASQPFKSPRPREGQGNNNQGK